MDPNRNMMEEIFKMTKDNNKMLHGMRRRAFIGGFIKILLYLALLLTPIWFYMTYLNDSVQSLMKSVEQMQGTGSSAMQSLSEFQNTLKDLQAKIPSFMTGSSTLNSN